MTVMEIGIMGGVGPMAAPFTLTLALSHRGRGDYWHTLTWDPLLVSPWEGEVTFGEGRGDFPGTSWHPAPLDGRTVPRAAGLRRNDVNVRVDVDGNPDNSEVWCYGT